MLFTTHLHVFLSILQPGEVLNDFLPSVSVIEKEFCPACDVLLGNEVQARLRINCDDLRLEIDVTL